MTALQTRGVLGCFVIERAEVPQMMHAADHGDKTAANIRHSIGAWMGLAFAPGAPEPRCAVCVNHIFSEPAEPEAFFLALPVKGDGECIVSGVCARCVRKIGSEGLLGRAAEHFKKVWPKAVVTGGGLDRRG